MDKVVAFFPHNEGRDAKGRDRSCRSLWGFPIFLAWYYCSFFSCGLLTSFITLCFIERVWMIAGAAQAVTVLLAMVAASCGLPLEGRGLAVVATLAVMSGSIGVYVCSPFLGEGLVPLVVASGVLLGFGKGILFLRWGQAACSLDEESVECAVPLSFALACVTYFLLIAFKQPAFIVIDLILPLVSLGLLLSERRALSHPVSEARDASARSLLPLFAVLLLLWGQFSFLRIVSSPTTLTNRFFHYVLPFSCALVFAIGLFGAYIRHGRRLNFSLVFRLSVPLLAMSYALLFANYTNATVRVVAHAINFMAMFGASIACWVVIPKYVRYGGISLVALFGVLLVAEGLGTMVGAACGLLLFDQNADVHYLGVALAALAVLLMVVPLAGADSRWSSPHRPTAREIFLSQEDRGNEEAAWPNDEKTAKNSEEKQGRRGIPEETTGGVFSHEQAGELAALFEEAARNLGKRYGLTRRETEIAALLLAGRSRPYIRDELTVSLSTVHSHVSNIYAKCGVHSQRDFMDLMEEEAGV